MTSPIVLLPFTGSPLLVMPMSPEVAVFESVKYRKPPYAWITFTMARVVFGAGRSKGDVKQD